MASESSMAFELATLSVGVSPHALDMQRERCAEQRTFDEIEAEVRDAVRGDRISERKPRFLSGRRGSEDRQVFYAWPADKCRAYLVRPKLVVVTVLVPNPDSPFRVLLGDRR